MTTTNRRSFIKTTALGTAALVSPFSGLLAAKPSGMKMGLVTYLWGKDWDLPTLIANCEKAKVLGVELRTMHKHGVEPTLSASERKEVKARFDDSPITCLGYGSNEQYDNPDPAKVKEAIENTRAFLQLSHDIGGTGVKVKPNRFHEGVPHEKTLEQIGKALRETGKIAADLGQEIRLEVHGRGTQQLPNIQRIMEVADHPNVRVCWNCNDQDLDGDGLEANFNRVKQYFGDTVHIREVNVGEYPYQELVSLFVEIDYQGWILLECRTDPADKVKAMIEQRKLWKKMTKQAKKNLK